MAGGISYLNAELGTQSLLKIHTKENPKVAKPILIPFLFLVPGFFVFPSRHGSCISLGRHPGHCQGSHPCPADPQPNLDHWLEQSEGTEGRRGRANNHFSEGDLH